MRSMNRSSLSYGFLLGFLGTLFFLQWDIQDHYPRAVWMVMSGLIVVCGVMIVTTQKRYGYFLVAITTTCGAGLSLLIVMHMTSHDAKDTLIYSAKEKTVTIAGIIADEADIRDTNARYTVDASLIAEPDGQTHAVTGRVLVVDYDSWPALSYGDAITARGKLSKPGMIDDFDYEKYLSLSGIQSVMYRANVKKVESGHRSHIMSALFTSKRWFERRITRLYPEPHASLAVGILSGSRGMMPDELTDAFKATGLTHIIAISGFNITIILTLLSRLLFWIPRRMKLLPLVVGITAFTIFTGASASVVRAAMMGILGLIALETGRQAQSRLLILWTAFFMTLWNPKLLWWDAGFQLSFLAVIGITEITPRLDAMMQRIPDTLAIRTSLAATLGAQIATLPLITYLFHRIAFIGLLTNLLVAPLVPLAMLFCFLGTMVSVVFFPLGQAIGVFGYLALDLIIKIAVMGASFPYGNMTL